MMNAEEQEYMDYLIHNRMELTKQNTRWLEEIEQLQKKLGIAVKALQKYMTFCRHPAEEALKEMEEVQ